MDACLVGFHATVRNVTVKISNMLRLQLHQQHVNSKWNNFLKENSMTDKLELKSNHEVVHTVYVADVESIFYCKPTDQDILTVVMKDGRRLYCDEICPLQGSTIVYVVTRCEEHSDYVEEVFFDEDKAQEYCDQFNGNENEYARHMTTVKVTL